MKSNHMCEMQAVSSSSALEYQCEWCSHNSQPGAGEKFNGLQVLKDKRALKNATGKRTNPTTRDRKETKHQDRCEWEGKERLKETGG